LAGKPQGKKPLGNPRHRTEGIIRKWILDNFDEKVWNIPAVSRYGPMVGSCKHGDESLGSEKTGNI
jgi:hypothetical protein